MLQIQDVRKTYPGFNLEVSMEVQAGRITGLIGANGAGKSTLFKAILSLIHTEGGTILLNGKNVASMTAAEKQKIGTVMTGSGFSSYLKVKDVRKILEAMYPTFDTVRFDQKSRSFGLDPEKKIKELSTGLKARLQVLSALCHKAEILLLDEPTAGLDVIARDEVYNLIREFMEEDENRSVLISSHISSDLELLCDEMYMIDKGKIILHEEADRLFTDYAILKLTKEDFASLDKKYLLRLREEPYGYCALTDQRAFYRENYPGMVMEKAGLDEVIRMMVKGDRL
jgi:ABC-2 type transport system ATP-binding protein